MMKDDRIISIAYNRQQFPLESISEVAIAGRSNCGKSSFINTISNAKFAKRSSKPGKTVSINFFKYSKKLNIVDLPGYGYAKISKSISAEWKFLIEDYLANRKTLKSVFVLIDTRRNIEDEEIYFIDWLTELGIPFNLIFTKIDKLTNNELRKRKIELLAQIEKLWHHNTSNSIFFISSAKRLGFDPVKEKLEEYNQQ